MTILLFAWMGRAAAQTYDGYEIYEGKFDEVNGIYYLPDDDWKEAEGGVLSTYSGSTVSFKNNVTFKLRKYIGRDEDNNPIYDYKEKTLPLTKIRGSYYKNPNVKGVYIPDNVKEIGPGSFDKFTGLILVTGCSGVEKIGASAFQSCTALKNASFVKVKEIGYRAFKGCTALETIGRVQSASRDWRRGFRRMYCFIRRITVNGTVGRYAFRNCEKITKVDISTTADSIGPAAFIGCSGWKP